MKCGSFSRKAAAKGKRFHDRTSSSIITQLTTQKNLKFEILEVKDGE
jgi:hypothetical protein